MIDTMERQLASQLPMSAIVDRLMRAGLEPSTAAQIPRWKAVELLELLGEMQPGSPGGR